MNLEDLIIYICQNYPHSRELSKARLTKLIYLIDWKSCLQRKRQLTNINWYFDNYGPYVDDVIDTARNSNHLTIEQETNFYGTKKERIAIFNKSYTPHISINDINLIKEVFLETQNLYWDDFIKHVYNTPPVKNSHRYSILNLNKFVD